MCLQRENVGFANSSVFDLNSNLVFISKSNLKSGAKLSQVFQYSLESNLFAKQWSLQLMIMMEIMMMVIMMEIILVMIMTGTGTRIFYEYTDNCFAQATF